ncbi:substrate-binding domain-containing protein [Bifidobacterium sp. B4081]|uniref:substrate-binding domain-containing protein n=1 Tax=unclassified Bifidobacterium TaxID=2608897 RepID=UPI002269F6FF|nr:MULTISPECIES: substrate-binding domain-containing protein [unclassified Bifidobacterium]MCX8644325.1 substrate-binding domain-containing protein [Bifidobacterium sp. B4077]MCX8646137.1 substrate-binding domain-containing protein [Bifidobacterium sp. B4081]MCX8668309.1 substrate-binding domain-containing protein [Bifidobacterium sp. B3998]
MIVPNLENGYYARNLKLLILISRYDNTNELRQIQELHSYKFDRLFVRSSHNSALTIQQVAKDVAITGFEGIEPGAYSVPTLTTVAVDFTEMARMAISMMLDHVGQQEGQEDPGRTPRRAIVGYHLLERESTLGIHAADTVQRDPGTQPKSI